VAKETLEQREARLKKKLAERSAGIQKQLDRINTQKQIAVLKAKLKKK
jgi:hypothetical protein